MRGRTYILIGLTLAGCLLMLNMHLFPRDNNEAKEISRYQYTQLETVINQYPEVAEAVSRDSKHEIVTVAEYKKMMQHVSRILSRKKVRVSALETAEN